MANEEQLSILRQGVEAWNKWRVTNPNVDIDLSEANLSATKLSRADLRQAKLRRANLNEANLKISNLWRADLRGALLVEADLRAADISEANLMEADLRQANLQGANLSEANLSEVNLTLASLIRANLTKANLIGAYLREADFSRAQLGYTIFGISDLGKIIGLDDVHHYAPSTISTDTIALSKGKIPEVFLRGCGLSDVDIEYAKLADPALDQEEISNITRRIYQLTIARDIHYYSCFISYNSRDEEFARQLHSDLQNIGVRCWFAPEDMKIGDQIRPRIEQEIRLRDKLLVIVSENSVKSEWVGDEVEAALEEERKGNRLVLFPIRLDDTVMSTRDDWAAKIKRRRHIGDFSNWKDKASYQKAFERLLRDLKATGGQVNGE